MVETWVNQRVGVPCLEGATVLSNNPLLPGRLVLPNKVFQEKLETQIFMYNLFIFSQVQKMV